MGRVGLTSDRGQQKEHRLTLSSPTCPQGPTKTPRPAQSAGLGVVPVPPDADPLGPSVVKEEGGTQMAQTTHLLSISAKGLRFCEALVEMHWCWVHITPPPPPKEPGGMPGY